MAASGWASRIVTAAVQLIAVRFLLESLGLERYAAFALLTGLQGWFLLSDFGVGVSVQNHVSEARALSRSPDEIVMAGRMLALLLLLLTVVALWFASPYFARLVLRRFAFLTTHEQVDLFFLTGSLSIGIGVGSIVYKVWYAQQRGYLANMLPAAAAVLGLAGIVTTRSLDPGLRLPASLLAFLAPPALLPLAILIQQLAFREVTPRLTWRLADVLSILQRAASFWAFAVLAALTLQIDYIVMAQFLNAHDITTYALATKIYALAFFVYNAVLMALWPVLAEHVAARRWDDVSLHLRRTLRLGLAYMVICMVAMVWFMPAAVRLLAPNQNVTLSVRLILLLGFYQVVRVWSDTFSTLLQAMSWLKPFWILVPAQAVLSIFLQWRLTPTYGLTGLVGGLTASFLLTVAWGLPLAARIRDRRNSTV